MKKLVSISMLLVMTLSLYAQHQDVTRFLGIPVDGSKKDMIQKLKAKGFESTSDPDILEGEFNGTEVEISVVTNNNKVWRIAVMDKNGSSKGDIKSRFNRLCQQFKNNSKYTPIKKDQTIPEDEDIRYEIIVNDKHYQAGFYQYNSEDQAMKAAEYATSQLASKYNQEELENPTPEIQSEMISLISSYISDNYSLFFNKLVWFTISQISGEFYITMFYDNEYNHANGEDL